MECCECNANLGGVLCFTFECKEHHLCLACYNKVKVKGCVDCEVCPLKLSGGLIVLIDNSNIWIEAKKIASAKKRFKTNEDPRVRLDIGNLMDILAKSRTVNKGYIFGSTPPPKDTFWSKYSEVAKCVAITYDRHPITKKEKQVDSSICCKMVSLAFFNKDDKRTVLVVLTGDLDVLPAIETVLENSQLSIELWSWYNSASTKLQQFAMGYGPRMSLNYLDQHMARFTFTSWKFDLTKTEIEPRVAKYGIVLTFDADTDLSNNDWQSIVEKLSRYPFQYYLLPNKQEVLLFFQDGRHLGCTFDIHSFLTKIQSDDKYSIPNVILAQTYRDYRACTVIEENWDEN